MDKQDQILERLEALEKEVVSTKKSLNILVEVIEKYTYHVYEMTIVWKREFKEKHKLSDREVGLQSGINNNEILAMSRQGITITAQAKKLGCSKQTIINHRNILKAQGKL